MPPHDQPWLAFSRIHWRGGFDRQLVRIFDDRIEVRRGRFAIETLVIPMTDVYGVDFDGSGPLRVVAVPEDVVIDEGGVADRALAADLIKKNAPPPREKPKPKPPPKPELAPPKEKPSPKPPPEPEPEFSTPPAPRVQEKGEPNAVVGVPDDRSTGRAVRALAILTVGTVATAVLIVVAIGVFAFVIVRLFQG